nr:MAG TPA: hypothetical protein [Bacteriophage sp.]
MRSSLNCLYYSIVVSTSQVKNKRFQLFSKSFLLIYIFIFPVPVFAFFNHIIESWSFLPFLHFLPLLG